MAITGTTGTSLDHMIDLIMTDKGLAKRIQKNKLTQEDLDGGATAANGINQLMADAISTGNLAADGNISVQDVVDINSYIRADNARYEAFLDLHGDDDGNTETGFHLVQNDGAKRKMFGENFVNTVADGMYHIGFEIQGNTILNEDGDANATLTDIASWLDYFYIDHSTTGTGLDFIVDSIKNDRGLKKNLAATDIVEGINAANGMNKILTESIEQQNLADDGIFTVGDIKLINSYIRENHLTDWLVFHGDDDGNTETGFHTVQGDGGKQKFKGKNLTDTVADGLYHLGFEIQGNTILNEDGDANASLNDLATWLNQIYLDQNVKVGTNGGDNDKLTGNNGNNIINGGIGDDIIKGRKGDDQLAGEAGNDKINGGEGNDVLSGGADNDKLTGGKGNDRLEGGTGDDIMNGGAGADVFIFSGTDLGHDVIRKFSTTEDRLSIDASLTYTLTQQGKKAVVEFADDVGSITLTGVNVEALTSQIDLV
ncbi:MAG: calcium-binding protein [bacterium]